jgi:SAM-dependent methyltransferase
VSTPDREEMRRLAGDSIARGDATGWFEELYRRAGASWDRIPWADLTPNPYLLEALDGPAAPAAGASCLVVGCGLGDDAEALAARGFEVAAFDVSPTAIAGCGTRFPGSRVEYVVADALAPPPAWRGRFDFVVEAYTLQVLPPAARAAAVAALASLVSPRGRLLVLCRAREPEEPEGALPWPLTRAELDAFRRAGLAELEVESFLDRETPPVRRFRALYERPDATAVRRAQDVARELVAELRGALGNELVGAYLYGSLIEGDFVAGVSDIDLVLVVARDPDEPRIERLRELHARFVRRLPEWRDRIDATYASTRALASFPEHASPIAVISPGEPMHRTETSRGWTINWHLARERGLALAGPPPASLIAPTTQGDFAAAVRANLAELPGRVQASRSPGFHAYAVLTACRGLCASSEGRQPSKTRAALWAACRYPAWSALIRDALAWRGQVGGTRERAALAPSRALEFVRMAAEECRAAGD